MVWGLGGLCVDVVGVHGVYVTFACVSGTYIGVQGVHVCEGCTRVQMAAFAEVCGGEGGTLVFVQPLRGCVCAEACARLWDMQGCAQRL